MAEYTYAKGRVNESLTFITQEMNEFESDYLTKTLKEYSSDSKLQKLMDRTIENVLTAVIEVSGTVLTENNISAESYAELLSKVGIFFKFEEEEVNILSRFAVMRNRLAHRYLNLRWQVVKHYVENRHVLKKLITLIFEYETAKQ